MNQSTKARIFILLLAALTTLFALMPPQPVQACPAYEIEDCVYPNGVTCRYHECPKHQTTCNGLPSGTPTCYSAGLECCV
ncbi:MAG TPA: hypothetical protein VHC97_04125 [Thermoanaerobaculia bacterium]|jgi:hypothetical protein|nr:hypothetical protein [Thermoanaerobaculia bacterium]